MAGALVGPSIKRGQPSADDKGSKAGDTGAGERKSKQGQIREKWTRYEARECRFNGQPGAANVASIASWPAGSVVVALINFVVIAFVVFLIVRALEATRRAEAAVAAPDPQAQLASAATRLADALDRRQL